MRFTLGTKAASSGLAPATAWFGDTLTALSIKVARLGAGRFKEGLIMTAINPCVIRKARVVTFTPEAFSLGPKGNTFSTSRVQLTEFFLS